MIERIKFLLAALSLTIVVAAFLVILVMGMRMGMQ
jgi:hypothetical protein